MGLTSDADNTGTRVRKHRHGNNTIKSCREGLEQQRGFSERQRGLSVGRVRCIARHRLHGEKNRCDRQCLDCELSNETAASKMKSQVTGVRYSSGAHAPEPSACGSPSSSTTGLCICTQYFGALLVSSVFAEEEVQRSAQSCRPPICGRIAFAPFIRASSKRGSCS